MQISSLDQLVGQDVGAYRLEHLLGHGQTNVVYLACHSKQNSPVALVMFTLPGTFSVEARQYFLLRFRKEAARLVALQHPHILPVHDYGEYAGHPYLVTPYMVSGSLVDMLKRRGRFHHADVLDILRQVVAGLAYAHRKGVFHGALKPSNILLNNQEQILVAGFGLTQILQLDGIEQDARPYAHLFSMAGTFLTAAEYIAPEVVLGQPADARTDIYSLGAILFELLSGRPPFTGTNPLEVALQHVQQPVPSLRVRCPDIPLALAAVVNQVLDSDPVCRFQRVDELLEAFAQVSALSSEQDTNEGVRAAQSARLQETPAVSYELRNWQFLPPIITDKVPSPLSSARQLAPSALWPAPEPVAKSSEEALFDLWTFPSQGSLPPHRLDSTQQNAMQAKRDSIQRFPLFEKKLGNEPLSRRRVVALLAAGGAVVAGTAIAINLTGNPSNQQIPNNAANLAKNAAMNFINPADGQANVLVHLTNGNFVAYNRACTHKGVYVHYDPTKQLLVCPAHGATFDPAQNGTVIQEVPQAPPLKPLPGVSVHINPDGTIVAG